MLRTRLAGTQTPEGPPDLNSMTDTYRFPMIGNVKPGEALTFRGARRWYISSAFSLAWLAFTAYDYFQSTSSLPSRMLAVATILLFALAVGLSVPIAWRFRPPQRVWVTAALWATSFVMWPVLGWSVAQTWVFVALVIGMSMYPMRMTLLLTSILTALALVFELADGQRGENLVWVPAIIYSMSMMMSGFGRQIAAINQLRATQHELARLAVEKERGRVARDIHDILGHSLTAITVKAELAGMLIEANQQQRAAREISGVEELARGALADVRATVAGYRGVNVVTELANARAILASAGIEAEIAGTVDALPATHHELAGWVVREGVTNVVRHSGAHRCRIRITADTIEIADDGAGLAALPAEPQGNGLRGLRERVDAAGAALRLARSDLGGLSLAVQTGAQP